MLTVLTIGCIVLAAGWVRERHGCNRRVRDAYDKGRHAESVRRELERTCR